ncbi:MAG: hypothetical protein II232_07460, partial [Spirochaetaceae bacterium]|nr:hypothetical protein [Spirochaetaceae bacterium]
MNRNFFSVTLNCFVVLFFSLFFFVSCSDTTPHISSLYKTLVYEFTSEDEIGKLGVSLNYMATKLNALDEDEKKFISNISHDFRSPLT